MPPTAKDEPIRSLRDARARLNHALDILTSVVAWIDVQLGERLAIHGLRRRLQDAGTAVNDALETLRDVRPDLDDEQPGGDA